MTTTFTVAGAGVREIASAVARRELTPSEVLESVLDRIAATEDKIQAWSQLDVEVARAEAEMLTAEVRVGTFRGPLLGVPVGIKEWFHVRGFPTLLRPGVALPEPEDATVVARLRAAGAIVVGKTHTPINGKNPPTRNPWNLAHTAGGTSSGSGAAVGARVVPVSVGEQTAGSNLRPAAYCGVAGIKPTYGRISRFGCYPGSWSRDHTGLIGLTMADIALVMSVVAGYEPKDPTTIPESPTQADLKMTEFRPPRIGVVRNFFPERCEPEMLAAIEASARRFVSAGAKVEDMGLPAEFGTIWSAASLISAEGAAFHAEHRVGETPAASQMTGRAVELVPATYYIQARRVRTWLSGMVCDLMARADLDALLMAVAPGAAPFGIESTGDASLLTPWSTLGFPAITVSAGLSPAGLPLGLQLVGPPKEDYELMRVGAWCEDVLGLLPMPPLS